jgi:hypothetical protein
MAANYAVGRVTGRGVGVAVDNALVCRNVKAFSWKGAGRYEDTDRGR